MNREKPDTGSTPHLRPRIIRWVGWDAGVIILACAATIMIGVHFDLIERFYQFSRAHDDWELDEFALIFVTLSVAGLFLAIRRFFQIRREYRLRIEAEQKMADLALNDSLTGLVNRRAFLQQLEDRLAKQKTVEHAVVMIDLDRFKPINDLYGHDAGDRVLQTVALRLKGAIKPAGVLARLGGDEFAALLSDASGGEELDRVVTRLQHATEEPVQIGSAICSVGASIGVAIVHPGQTATVSDLLKQADMALYNAKRGGRARHVYFDEEMNRKATKRSRLEMDLRRAVDDDEIQPYYQPLIRLSDGGVEGYEILARWRHAELGDIPPEEFIPIAEDAGLINPLTRSIFRKACEDAREWPDGLFMSLNISPVQLRNEGIVEDLTDILGAFGHPPDFLEVEITENALVEDTDMAKQVLQKMADSGIRIALDDFGTGYASINQLRALPFTKLKIDKSFITSMQDNLESRQIVTAVLALSQSLGLACTAEGIESPEVAEWLKEAGCGMGQGFYFGRPGRDVLKTLAEPGASESAARLEESMSDADAGGGRSAPDCQATKT